MIDYIKDNVAYLGDIRFQIHPAAFVLAPNSYNDLTTICQTPEYNGTPDKWYLDWGYHKFHKPYTTPDQLFDGYYEPKYDIFSEPMQQLQCNDLSGWLLFFGSKTRQKLLACFPADNGYYFISAVINTPGTPDLAAIKEVYQNEIVKTVFETIFSVESEETVQIEYAPIKRGIWRKYSSDEWICPVCGYDKYCDTLDGGVLPPICEQCGARLENPVAPTDDY